MLFSALPFLIPSALAAQPSAPSPISGPLRDLEFGQLNFLHTTDTHGWLAGHLQEPSFSADWGDYISFSERMREKVEAQGQDLLVIDTGDRVEGNGLYDSSEPKGVYLSEILRHQHIDVITSGNHELYKQNTSESELLYTVPNFRGKYLASNIDIYHPETGELVPLAPRYKKFTTKRQGIRIVAFGFLFDFTGNYNNTVVQRVEDTIKEDWFQEAIRDHEVDLFLVAGHVPAHSSEYRAIYQEIRGIRWDTPIQFFGGHQHIRDYAKYDSKAVALASGRFMETIGFMSIDGLSTSNGPSKTSQPIFNRRYIDNNLLSFYHHTGLDADSFPTKKGRKVSRLIAESRTALQLDQVHGCAPKNLWMSRVPYPNPDSIYTWLETEVLTQTLKDEARGERPSVAILNSGAIRFDIFKGVFTQDTTWTISPFTNGFRYVKDVPYEKVQLIMEVLNKQTKILTALQDETEPSLLPLASPEQLARPETNVDDDETSGQRFTVDMSGSSQLPLSVSNTVGKILPGYTTKDDAGEDGDDTIHAPISFYKIPNCIQALISANSSDVPEKVDLVYIEFVQPYLALAAKFAGLEIDFVKESDVYMPNVTLTDLILEWVRKHWKCE
ncbi:Ser/Thr protein phosphatase family [Penicillium brasilianum]|uniref:Ser/Thr protein phosphatase family n=1 Tax=Penicillium brasilianum TaxID=104259 RepID=A0A1S9RMP1_PENBI|nr:Ser/Thr protein phosphatase family [Penicillium brasilianum]